MTASRVVSASKALDHSRGFSYVRRGSPAHPCTDGGFLPSSIFFFSLGEEGFFDFPVQGASNSTSPAGL